MNRATRAVLLLAAASVARAAETAACAPLAAPEHRVVIYYQSQYVNNLYLPPLGLTQNNAHATDLLVAAVHINSGSPPFITLNDDPPGAARYAQMWTDVRAMQALGVRVSAMVGGAAQGSFQRLDNSFGTYYPLLKNFIATYGLDGVDLDVEEAMSLAGIERVIDALRADFGPGFIITLAPVATALSGGGNLSGFNYETLYQQRASSISWFNAQFYCGWGNLGGTAGYSAIINRGVIPASKVVAGTLTNPANCGSGYVALGNLQATLRSLVSQYPAFGGVAGWEYFNSLPGDSAAPWLWAGDVANALGAPAPGTGGGPITGLAGKCADVSAGNSANGTAIQLYDCNATASQLWEPGPAASLRALGKCLDVAGGATGNGAFIQLYDCNGTGAQQWQAQPGGALHNPASGRCLDVAGGSTANGTRLELWDCTGVAGQQWRPPPRVTGLRAAKSGNDAQLSWNCASVSCPAAAPAKVFRSTTAGFIRNPALFNGGASNGTGQGSCADSGALAPGDGTSYYWRVE